MKIRHILAASAVALFCSAAAIAQAPAGAPAGATGTCKDGTYSMAASKSGACSGHKGVAAWYGPAAAPKAAAAAPAPAPMAAPKPAPAAAPAPAPAPMAAAKPAPAPAAKGAKTAAPGGGPGMVWVNTSTKVYHCYGKEDYGTTKAGKYESEAQAKADGFRPAYNKACGM